MVEAGAEIKCNSMYIYYMAWIRLSVQLAIFVIVTRGGLAQIDLVLEL